MTADGLTAGVSGLSRQGCVALADSRRLLGVCEQQRITRIRGAGCNASGLPDEALDTMLERAGHSRGDITHYVTAEAGPDVIDGQCVGRLDHHLAHACTAYLSSSFPTAVIVVCDHEAPKVSVWEGRGAEVTRLAWPWQGPGFADLYSACATLLGFAADRGAQQMEALARLRPNQRDSRIDRLFDGDGTSLRAVAGWESQIETSAKQATEKGGIPACTGIAAALQGRIGDLLLAFLSRLRRHTSEQRLCLAGSLFYHSSINTIVKQAGLFPEVFVPIDPGNTGLAVGTALQTTRREPQLVTPFAGPAYTAFEIKATLDNCKLRYDWQSDAGVIESALRALRNGALIAWFEGGMEWGPRALGARSILASPFAPFVLENLNGFLKHRQSWRRYALSALADSVLQHFDGPAHAPFMECDYRPRDRATFRHVLPDEDAAIRVHSVGPQAPPRFRRLLEAWGAVTGIPCLVNTSFNGFHEPMVCSPRDAIRVFYGSGVDMLVVDRFVLMK